MEDMGLEEEWKAQILSIQTRKHHSRGLALFREYLGENLKAEQLIQLKQQDRRLESKIVLFYKWMQSNKGLTANSARSYCIALQSLYSYGNAPLKLKNLPKLTMKLETWRPTLQDLQQLYAFADLEGKTWLSLQRDCPARIGDLLTITPEQIEQGEFLLKSRKESIVSKVYVSPQTQDLFRRCKEAKVQLPKTQRGVCGLLQKCCRLANVNHTLNPHLMRKLWITCALNLQLNETIVRILSFKSVEQSMLTYFLERDTLRQSWEKVINALPLTSKSNGNGQISNIQDALDLVFKVLRQLCEKELESRGHFEHIGLTEKEPTDKEFIEYFLKTIALKGERK